MPETPCSKPDIGAVILTLLSMRLYQDAIPPPYDMAMFINILIAVVVGLSIPLLRYKFGKDPAVGASIILTAITDSMGVFIFSDW